MPYCADDVILAIDSSPTSPGFCLRRMDGTVLRTWSLKPRCSGIERNQLIVEEIARCAPGVRMVFIEGYSYRSRFNRELLAELVGAIKLRLYSMGIPFRAIPPAQHKKFTTGHGEAPGLKGEAAKQWYKTQIEQIAGLHFANDDEADAWSLGNMGIAVLRALEDPAYVLTLLPHQQEVLLRHCEREILDAPCLLADPTTARLIHVIDLARARKRRRRTGRRGSAADGAEDADQPPKPPGNRRQANRRKAPADSAPAAGEPAPGAHAQDAGTASRAQKQRRSA